MSTTEVSTLALRQMPRLKASAPPVLNQALAPRTLAAMSHTKLRREASAQEPDLRRCLGHHNILLKSMNAARETPPFPKKQAKKSSVQISVKEEQPSTTTTNDQAGAPHFRAQITNAVKAMTRRRNESAPKATETDMGISGQQKQQIVRVSSISSGNSRRKDTMADRSRHYASKFGIGRNRSFLQAPQVMRSTAVG